MSEKTPGQIAWEIVNSENIPKYGWDDAVIMNHWREKWEQAANADRQPLIDEIERLKEEITNRDEFAKMMTGQKCLLCFGPIVDHWCETCQMSTK